MLSHLRIFSIFWVCTISFILRAQDIEIETLQSAAPESLKIGGVLHSYGLDLDDNPYVELADREFDSITASAYMPYGPWDLSNLTFDFEPFSQVVDWATERGKKVHGHVLLYPTINERSQWWDEIEPEDVEPMLELYITGLALARAGDVMVWDVVNEVMADAQHPTDENGLRTDFYEYQVMGPEYVAKAFAWAHAADPNAILILNEYDIELPGDKADRTLAFATGLRDAGIPIDGIGFQMHVYDTIFEPDYAAIKSNLQRFADAGFRLYITELDVLCKTTQDANSLPSIPELERQKRIYQNLAAVFYSVPQCEALWLWDYADNESWLHPSRLENYYVQLGDWTFPSIFGGGRDTVPFAKPAYFGLKEGLKGTPYQGPQVRVGWLDSRLATRTGFLYRTSPVEISLESNKAVGLTTKPTTRTQRQFHWEFVPYSGDIYWIRNRLGTQTRYLSRTAIEVEGEIVAGPDVYFEDYQSGWISQLWQVWDQPNGLTIRNLWDPGTGYLTRDTERTRVEGRVQAIVIDTVSLRSRSGTTSQNWRFFELPPALCPPQSIPHPYYLREAAPDPDPRLTIELTEAE